MTRLNSQIESVFDLVVEGKRNKPFEIDDVHSFIPPYQRADRHLNEMEVLGFFKD